MAPHIRDGATKGLENLGIKLALETNMIATCRNAELEISSTDDRQPRFS
jgi:hypothetical protein